MTGSETGANSRAQIDQLLAKICERALERQDYETARDADCAIRRLRRWVDESARP